MAERRPNILFIYSDQHRYDCLSGHGHPLVQTPNLDRLLHEGCDFSHAFTPSPICVPARCSLLSGQYPVQHGVIHNFDGEAWKPLDTQQPTHPRVVSQAGYHSYHIGRWHVDPQRGGQDFGFQEFQQDWRYGKYLAAQELKAARQPDNLERPFLGGRSLLPAEQSSLFWHARQVIERLKWQQTHDADPFFIHWHSMEPHLPCYPAEPFASRYDPASIEPWPGFADDLASKPFIQRQMPVTWNIQDMSWDDWRLPVARYFGIISQMDAAIGLVLDALDDLGMADDTLVVYSTDHGDMCGSHHMVDKHNNMYDDICRVPLIMRQPGCIPAGAVRDDFVSNVVDLAATFCQVAGADVPDSFAGEDIHSVARGQRSLDRTDIYASFSGNQFGSYSQRMLRERRWKYVWNATAEDELYDLASDPGECHNLIADVEAQAELPRLRGRLAAWMQEIGDPLFNGFTKRQFLEGCKLTGFETSTV
jgi:arylsulfatase A-like enzyme